MRMVLFCLARLVFLLLWFLRKNNMDEKKTNDDSRSLNICKRISMAGKWKQNKEWQQRKGVDKAQKERMKPVMICVEEALNEAIIKTVFIPAFDLYGQIQIYNPSGAPDSFREPLKRIKCSESDAISCDKLVTKAEVNITSLRKGWRQGMGERTGPRH